jgi:hypothetical protein
MIVWGLGQTHQHNISWISLMGALSRRHKSKGDEISVLLRKSSSEQEDLMSLRF